VAPVRFGEVGDVGETEADGLGVAIGGAHARLIAHAAVVSGDETGAVAWYMVTMSV